MCKLKYPREDKSCPVCRKLFTVSVGSPKEKVTCSHSCSNTYFRSGADNPNYRALNTYNLGDSRKSVFSKKYREVCFAHHVKKCVVCEECLILDVHHLDGNKMNNSPKNLIPMCPTHHGYWHSEHRHYVEDIVREYITLYNERRS